NSYVNLKIATCLVRYADDRLIDQRFPSADARQSLSARTRTMSASISALHRVVQPSRHAQTRGENDSLMRVSIFFSDVV
ncbi:hypothetical protein, partial [Burkholderia multivorans]|uniref:hypothetical protein n=1 Tax=Burkholderia multivorans TaxID=87883 RepID=UPI001C6141B0